MIGIQNYLNTDTNTPLIVHGETGAGKSSIIAAVVKQLLEKTKDHESHEKSTILIVRFVGLTTLSCSIKKLLNSISDQVSKHILSIQDIYIIHEVQYIIKHSGEIR